MSMTANRRRVYERSWFKREAKFDIRKRRKEYNRKIRHVKIDEDTTEKAVRLHKYLYEHTVS